MRFFEAYLRQSSPLIIIGMHRSGTSLVMRLLAAMGLETGKWCSPNQEALLIQHINRTLLRQAQSSWFDVQPFLASYNPAAGARLAREMLYARFRYLRYYLPATKILPLLRRQEVAWGWKDPRNTITLPVWLRLFPQARVVHIVRNGLEVARSLVVRESSRTRGENDAYPFDVYQDAFQLWETYVGLGTEAQHLVPQGRYLAVRYEDLYLDWEGTLKKLAAFGRLAYDPHVARALHASLKNRPPGAATHLPAPDEKIVSSHSAMMRLYGYGS